MLLIPHFKNQAMTQDVSTNCQVGAMNRDRLNRQQRFSRPIPITTELVIAKWITLGGSGIRLKHDEAFRRLDKGFEERAGVGVSAVDGIKRRCTPDGRGLGGLG